MLWGTIKPQLSSRYRELRLEVGTYHDLLNFVENQKGDSERVFVE